MDEPTEYQLEALVRAAKDQAKYRSVVHPFRRGRQPRPTVVNIGKDRSLSGKARRRARKAGNGTEAA